MRKMIDKIKKIIIEGVEKQAFPGGQFCLFENGNINCDYYGYKEIVPNKILLIGNEVYDIASLSKIISTTTIIFKMIENNLLNLNTKIVDVLPRFQLENTTISDLLTHSSGLPAMIKNARSIKSKETLINDIYEVKLVYEPNTKIVYSDLGFIILGLVIENIMKKPLNEVAEELLFKPLKMTNTTYRPSIELSVPTEIREGEIFNGLLRGVVHDEVSYLMEGISGHAGVFSNAYDIALYIKSVLSDELVFSQETKKTIFETNIFKEDLNKDKLVRTFGFNKYLNKPNELNNLIFHTGFTGCNLWIDNKTKRGFVLLSNAVHPKRELNKIFSYREKILSLFYK